MGIYRRPDSPFWWLCLERPGQRPVRESTRIPVDGGTPGQTRQNRELAEAAYAARMGDLARQRYRLPTDRPRITFAKFREWYSEQFTQHKRGADRERSMLRQLGRYFDRDYLHTIERAAIMQWRTARARAVAPATVNRELHILRHLLGQAVPTYLEANPAARVPELHEPEEEPRILSREEEPRLLKVCTIEDRALILCALDTLQRLTSIVSLNRAHDHGRYLTVLNPKTTGYKVPVSRRLRAALDALPANGAFYFASFQRWLDPERRTLNTQGRRNAVIRRFQELCARAGIPTGRKAGGLSFHCLRHTGASRMIERGVDLETVRRIGGWANLKVLQKYLHPTDRAAVEAVEAVGTTPPRGPQRRSAFTSRSRRRE